MREGWRPGPWDDEPEDRIEWKDEATGLSCLMRRNRNGAWCGYVAVPPSHPAHSKDYDEVDVRVHGGLTYSAKCHGDICHVPAPGEPDDVWWLGFDCAHSSDITPSRRDPAFAGISLLTDRGIPSGLAYRTRDYVRNEVTRLAAQLKELQ